MTTSLDWVDLERVPENTVHEDAFVDWDAEGQVWITAGEAFSELPTALVKSTVVYPVASEPPFQDFDRINWHDSSPFDIADIMMGMITRFDRAKEESPLYDESYVADFEGFTSSFKGWRILEEQPLVIEYYSDAWVIDGENMVTTLWPQYETGEAAWHVVGLGNRLEAGGSAAYSEAKAEENEVPWMDFVTGPTVGLLAEELEAAAAENYIPYEPTMGRYVSAEEAAERYENLAAWYDRFGHFWVNTGPFFLQGGSFSTRDQTVILERNPDFPDAADRWAHFAVSGGR